MQQAFKKTTVRKKRRQLERAGNDMVLDSTANTGIT